MRTTGIFCLMVALVMGGTLVSAPAASTWHVAPNGSDANNGTSWAQAWATISNAVAQAVSNDTILVSNGTYAISAEILLTNTALTIQGYMNGVYGGLSVASNTIVRRGAAGAAAPQHRIFNIGGGTGTNVLDGLTVTNGYLNGLPGGGIYVKSPALIRHCIVTGNTASNSPQYQGGGGIHYASTAGAITNSIIEGNYSGEGGGITLWASRTEVRNCLIRFNTSTNADWYRGGGGIYMSTYASMYDSTIVSNRNLLGYGGGVFCYCGSQIILDGCLIQGNTARYGGGLELREGTGPTVFVRNNRIIGNIGTTRGGGIDLSNNTASPQFYNNLIADNSTGGNGGAIYSMSWLNPRNCTITRNSAGAYGAIYGTTLGNVITTNVIAYHNTPDTSFVVTFTYSCAPPTNLIHGINGNTTNDPQFMVNAANGDYRLRPNSPCVNTGTNQAWMMDALDVAGTRRLDIFLPPIVDMGAYEFHPAGAMFSGR